MDKVNNKTHKIIVKPDFELTDLLRAISSSNSKKVLLTFTQASDLLISPINLKVLQEMADEQEKALIAQIINNPSGLRNAQEAGLVVTSSSSAIDENLWERAMDSGQHRDKQRKESLKKSIHETPPPMEKQSKTETTQKVVDEKTDPTPTEAPVKVKKDSEFTKKVAEALQKSKETIEANAAKTVTSGSVKIALDQDITQVQAHESTETTKEMTSLVGRSLVAVPQENKKDGVKTARMKKGKAGGKFNLGALKANLQKKILAVLGKLKGKSAGKVALLVLLPIILIAGGVFWMLYKFTPLVNIDLTIESSPVALQRDFTGDPSITEFNTETSKIRVKKETISKGLSENGVATGTAFRGEKASGLVTVKCLKFSGTEVIPAGTLLTEESSGLAYTTVNDLSVSCPGQTSVTVTAADVGEEYNLPSGSLFSVAGYDSSEVAGVNDATSLTGGVKEQYKVISQKDVDDLVEKLTKATFADAEGAFKDKEGEGWTLISSTVKHKVSEDGPQTDKPVGAETDTFNLSVSTESTALYYNKKDIDEVSDQLLLEAAQKGDLFADEEELGLKLHDEILKEIKVKSVKGNTVVVELKVSGAVVPDVDDDKIVNDLRGKEWQAGMDYLNALGYLASTPEVNFSPTWMPENLWYFPTRQGRIIVKIELQQ